MIVHHVKPPEHPMTNGDSASLSGCPKAERRAHGFDLCAVGLVIVACVGTILGISDLKIAAAFVLGGIFAATAAIIRTIGERGHP